MAISLIDKLKSMKLTEFAFSAFEKKVSSAGSDGERNQYLVLDLVDPIPKVTGSNGMYDPSGETDKRAYPTATDVVTVRVNLDMISNYENEFKFDEDGDKLVGSGSYSGDLFLDIARSGDVWLTDTKFSKMSGDWKKKQRSEVFQKFFTQKEEIKKDKMSRES